MGGAVTLQAVGVSGQAGRSPWKPAPLSAATTPSALDSRRTKDTSTPLSLSVIPAALLFGALSAGATTMQLTADVSIRLIDIIQALVIFFVAADTVVEWVVRARQKKAVVTGAE